MSLLLKLLPSKEVGKDILGGVKQTLTTARGILTLVPGIPALPLAVDAILNIIIALETASGNKKGFKELTTHLHTLITYVLIPIASAAKTSRSKSEYAVIVPGDLLERINMLCSKLIEISRDSNKLATYSRTRHFLRSTELSGALTDLNAKMNAALNMFRLGGEIRKEMLLVKIEKTLTKMSTAILDQNQRELLDKLPYALAKFSASKASLCLGSTRHNLLQAIYRWIDKETSRDRPSVFMFWLCGRPGEGKSTVAKTVATYLNDSHRLAASFFFSRDDKHCNSIHYLLPTIARQLAFFNSDIAVYITEFLKNNPDAGSDSMQYQLQHLIIEPLRMAHSKTPVSPFVIVLDALDECTETDQIRILLRLLATEVGELPFPVLLFITSRLELELITEFNSNPIRAVSRPIRLYDIDDSTVTTDIEYYLEIQLREFSHSCRPSDDLWPSRGDIERLAKRASGLFIYAATVVKFIQDDDGIPSEQLRMILDVQSADSQMEGNPYALIDNLYLQILNKAVTGSGRDLCSDIHVVLGTVVTLQLPLSYNALMLFLGLKHRTLHSILRRLSSVIHYSPSDDDEVRVWHQSFPDFLARCTDPRFRIDPVTHHTRLAKLSLELLLSDTLRRGMGFKDPSKFNSEVPDVNKSIPPHLAYASLYFVQHVLNSSSEDKEVQNLIDGFFKKKLLNWFEVLSLMNCLNTVITSLTQLQYWHKTLASPDRTITQLIYDAERFILQFFDPISQSALHVYHSTLSFVPDSTLLQLYEGEHTTSRVTLVKGRMKQWSSCVRVIEAHAIVRSVAPSSDSSQIVSGSDDKTVRVWDATSGALQATLQGHFGVVHSVKFSPDNSRIVSGSADGTVRLWDVMSGALQTTCEGHSSEINSVVFSPDSSRIVSGSDDKTIRVWDASSGTPQATLTGHSDIVFSVAFSSDNSRILSGSADGTVRLWDVTASGALEATLHGHSSNVRSVRFSSDNSQIVSGSDDQTIRLWDASSGTLQATFRGHSAQVISVAFSSDDSRIVSGSRDMSVRVWDAASGTLQATFQGHSDAVFSVSFFDANSRIISGSPDGSIRVWNATADALHTTVQEHSDHSQVISGHAIPLLDASGAVQATSEENVVPSVAFSSVSHSVAFSSDTSRVVSGTVEGVVRVWDATSGALHAALHGHHGIIYSVAFSSDNSRIVSGSKDNTIRVWDASSGALQALLTGHSDAVTSVAFSSDNSEIVSGSFDQTIRVWNATSSALHATCKGHVDYVNSVAFSSHSSRIISGSDDMTIRLWDASSGALQTTLHGHSDIILSVAFSSDDSQIFSSSQDNTVRVWDAFSGDEITVWRGADRLISDTFLLDSLGWLISVASDGYERICWVPVSLRNCLHVVKHPDETGESMLKSVYDTGFDGTRITYVLLTVQTSE